MTKTRRILLYTSKGGVGKTSVAAATALRCAEMGYQTIVLSTDPAHSLADSFDQPLGPEPTEVVPNLWGQEVDLYHSIEKHWSKLQEYMASVFTWQGVSELMAEEIAALPGMEEGAELLWIEQHYRQDQFDVIIVDCAPTAETLRLLSLPDSGRWWFDRLFPIGRRATQMLAPLARPFLNDMPLPDQETLNSAESLFEQLGDLYQLLSNPDLASTRLVINPEKMVIKEAQRTYTYLSLYGYVTDAVICNRIFPAGNDPYFAAWRETQQRYLQLIHEAFAPLPILKIPFFDQEVVGLYGLRRMAQAMYADDDPARLFYRGKTHNVAKSDGGYVLSLALPFITSEEVSLLRSGDELAVQVGNWRRNLVLPRALHNLEVERAKFDQNLLKIYFLAQQKETEYE